MLYNGLLSFVASHCDSNGPKTSCKTRDAFCLLIVSNFSTFESENIFWNTEEIIPLHALRLKSSCTTSNTHSASETATFSFKMGSNVMWWFWNDDDGEVLSTETVVSSVTNLLQLFPKTYVWQRLILWFIWMLINWIESLRRIL